MNLTMTTRVALVFALLLQVACSGLQTTGTDGTQARKAIEKQLLAMECWELNGKLGIRTPEEAHGIWLEWQQSGPQYEMRLSGPLGVGGAEISGGPGRIQMRVAEDRILVGESPESLVEREFGWRLPLSNLVYWVRGVRAPGDVERQRLNDQNLLAELDQHGWQLDYLGHAAASPGSPPLPEKVRLTHVDIVVTVVIKGWAPHACS